MKKSIKLLLILGLINSITYSQVATNKDSAAKYLPDPPQKISGKSDVCNGTAQTYSIPAVKNARSYFWSLPQGWTGSSTTTSINVTVGNISGNLCVLSVNDSGMSRAVRILPVSISSIPPQPGKIKGDTFICPESAKTYIVDDVFGARFYTWTLPSGWKGTSSKNSIALTSGNKSGLVTVTAGNICGSSIPRNINVEINSPPDQPGKISVDTTSKDGNYKIYTIEPVKGATNYTWTLPAGWIGASTSISIKAIPGPSGGTITVKANNICGSGNISKVSVTH